MLHSSVLVYCMYLSYILYSTSHDIHCDRLANANDSKLSQTELMKMITFGAEQIFSQKGASITDADIDTILQQGDERTRIESEKLQKNVQHNLNSFSLDNKVCKTLASFHILQLLLAIRLVCVTCLPYIFCIGIRILVSTNMKAKITVKRRTYLSLTSFLVIGTGLGIWTKEFQITALLYQWLLRTKA
jgi:hypothetical protein